MRRKNIKSVLSRKMAGWLKHVDDESVREAIREDALVCGGAITSMLMGEQVNDYDVYFRTKASALAVARYYVQKFKDNPPPRFADSDALVNIEAREMDGRIKIVVKSQGIAGESGTDDYRYFEQVDDDAATGSFVENVTSDAKEAVKDEEAAKPKYRPKFLTSNAITLSNRLQVVIRFCGEIEDIHHNYDFIHCMCGWDYGGKKLVIPQEAVESMLAKHLVYRGSLYPICSLIRTRKFIARGWTIDAGQYVKMAWDTHALDLNDINVLEDQMVGVDAAYFYEVLDILRKGIASGKALDRTYLMEVIDRVFS